MEKNISAAEAKKLDEIEKKLIKEFKEQIKIEDNYEKIKWYWGSRFKKI